MLARKLEVRRRSFPDEEFLAGSFEYPGGQGKFKISCQELFEIWSFDIICLLKFYNL